jgi:protein Mpv17
MSKVFADRPYLFSSLTGSLSFSLGDALAQSVEIDGDSKISLSRAVAIGGLGVVLNGFVMVKWFAVLDRYVGASMTSPRVLLTKTVLDQIIYAPFSITTFFAYTTFIFQGNTNTNTNSNSNSNSNPVDEVSLVKSPNLVSVKTEWLTRFKAKMQDKFITTFEADCAVWPLINVLQFRCVPLHLRPTVNGISSLLWQAYLSHQAESRNAKVKEKIDS